MLHVKRLTIKHAVIVYEVGVLLLAAFAFYRNPNRNVFETFSHDLGINITSHMFAVGCLVFAALSLVILREQEAWRRRYLYVTCASPLIAYTIPVGYYLLVTGGSAIAVVIYLAFYFALVLLAFTTFREEVGYVAPAVSDAGAPH